MLRPVVSNESLCHLAPRALHPPMTELRQFDGIAPAREDRIENRLAAGSGDVAEHTVSCRFGMRVPRTEMLGLHSLLPLLQCRTAHSLEVDMPMQVCMGASMMCSFGMAPSSLAVLPTNRVMTDEVPDANIMDHIPLVNIMPFGMCMSPANPEVAAATAAAMGVLTPMPCIPVTPAPWVPGAPNVLLGDMPTLDDTSTLMCTWGGVITFVTPGEFTVQVP